MIKLKLGALVLLAYSIAMIGALQAANGGDGGPPVVSSLSDAGPTDDGKPAQVVDTVVPKPDEDGARFASYVISKVKQSEWLPVFGCALMLAAWGLRALLIKASNATVPWASKAWGGRLIAFGSSLALTVGTALAAKDFSVGLLGTALAAAWVAAGQWEDRKDLAKVAKSPPTPNPLPDPAGA